MYVARKVSIYIYMLYKYDVLMTSALAFTTIFWQIRNKDVKVGPCLRSKLQLLKLPCFWSLIIEIFASILLDCIMGFAKSNSERTKLIQIRIHKINYLDKTICTHTANDIYKSCCTLCTL